MKLRFRKNSLRLRVNQREVHTLASGVSLKEEIHFPGGACIAYVLQVSPGRLPEATFNGSTISVCVPGAMVNDWAAGNEIGLYFDLPAQKDTLAIAIEKDLECLDSSPGETDPDAFPRVDDEVC